MKKYLSLMLLLATSFAYAQDTMVNVQILLLRQRSPRNIAFTAAMPFERTVIETANRQGNIALPNRYTQGIQATASYWHTIRPYNAFPLTIEAGLGGGAHSIGFRTDKLNDYMAGQNFKASPTYRTPYGLGILNVHTDMRLLGNMRLDVVAGVQYRRYLPFPLNARGSRLNDTILGAGIMWNNPTRGDLKLHLGTGVLFPLRDFNMLRVGVGFDFSQRRNVEGAYWLLAGTDKATTGLFHANGNGIKAEISYIFTDKKVVSSGQRTRETFAQKRHDLYVGYTRQIIRDGFSIEQPADFYVKQPGWNFSGGRNWSAEYALSGHWRIGAAIGQRQMRMLFNYTEYKDRSDQRSYFGTQQQYASLYGKYSKQISKRWVVAAQAGGTFGKLPKYKAGAVENGVYSFNTYSEKYQFQLDNPSTFTADLGISAEYHLLRDAYFFVEGGYHLGLRPAMQVYTQYKTTPVSAWQSARALSNGSFFDINIGIRYRLSQLWR